MKVVEAGWRTYAPELPSIVIDSPGASPIFAQFWAEQYDIYTQRLIAPGLTCYRQSSFTD